MIGFIIRKRVIGPGWQIRVRDLSTGYEETAAIVSTLEEAQQKYDQLALTMRPLSNRPDTEGE
jgi:hypothetical protein